MKTEIKKHRKIISILLMCIILIACGVYIANLIYLNHRFPKVEREVHQMNEQYQWFDYKITVKNYELLTADEVEKRWSNAIVMRDTLGSNDKILVAEIQVEYTGDNSTSSFPITKVCGQSGAWTNASEYTLLKSINNEFICKKGETSTFFTAINVKQVAFPKGEWKNLSARNFELVFSTYPDIVSVELK